MKVHLMIRGQPDADRRSCGDCAHCQGALTWRCVNRDAIKARGTNFPGVIYCHYWEPCFFTDGKTKKEQKQIRKQYDCIEQEQGGFGYDDDGNKITDPNHPNYCKPYERKQSDSTQR